MGGASTQARMDHRNAFVYALKADFVGHPHGNSGLYGDGSDPLTYDPTAFKPFDPQTHGHHQASVCYSRQVIAVGFCGH